MIEKYNPFIVIYSFYLKKRLEMDTLIACHECDLLHQRQPLPRGGTAICVRCGAKLYSRKRNSLDRVLALTIAGLVLFCVANVYPLLTFRLEAQVQETTLISGVIALYDQGMWIVAGVVFLTSVFVPLLKLFLLTFLLISVQRRSQWRRKDRTRLYRITEAVGRWSMVDIYVVTILVALVKLGSLATIQAGPGAIFFAGVVIITIFGAMSFDPRLIWDTQE